MSERKYQQKMLESNGKIIMCDWGRAKGKSYSIAKGIIEKTTGRPISILVISSYDIRKTSINLQDNLSDMWHGNVESRGFGHIFMTCNNDANNKVTKANIILSNNLESTRGCKVDYVFCDEYMPSSDELSIFFNSGTKQVYVMGTFDMHYISDKETVIDNEEDWIDEQIKELMQEFKDIPKNHDTTKRREVVLSMIAKIKGMKQDVNN